MRSRRSRPVPSLIAGVAGVALLLAGLDARADPPSGAPDLRRRRRRRRWRRDRGRDRDRRPRRRERRGPGRTGREVRDRDAPEQRLEPHARQARGRRRGPAPEKARSSTTSRATRASSTPSRWRVYRETFVPDDPLYASKQWHLRRVGAEKAWSYTCGQGVTVAVVDTGIACFDKGPFSRGTDLAGTRCEGGWNFVDDTREAYDDQGHGTHVAGTIAQTTEQRRGGGGARVLRVAHARQGPEQAGLRDASRTSPKGSASPPTRARRSSTCRSVARSRARSSKDAVEHALDAGVVIVAAAGNSGKKVGWPAAYPGVVAVSATDDTDKIAWFSSRGPEVAIAAPGVGVTQQTVCNGGRDKCEIFGTFNGTSMASPHVAGVAAMIESLGVTRGDAVREALYESARAPGRRRCQALRRRDPRRRGGGVARLLAALRAARAGARGPGVARPAARARGAAAASRAPGAPSWAPASRASGFCPSCPSRAS